jgi:hypothetical protein
VVSSLEGNKRKVLIKKEVPQLEDDSLDRDAFENSEEIIEPSS